MTTLVFGAGVSQVYGYPSGTQLLDEIKNRVKDKEKLYYRLLRQGQYSIDKFIWENEDLAEDIKHHILEIILGCENRMALLEPDLYSTQFSDNLTYRGHDDFYRYFLNTIEPEDYPKYQIITFNYDRSFECRLLEFLESKNKLQFFKALKIHHIHGRLPYLEHELSAEDLKQKKYFNTYQGVVMANEGHEVQTARGIRVLDVSDRHFHDTYLRGFAKTSLHIIYGNSEVDDVARKMLSESKRIFFLGFGYNHENILKLGFNFKVNTGDVSIAGTSLGLDDISASRLRNRFSALQMLYSMSVMDFFRKITDIQKEF